MVCIVNHRIYCLKLFSHYKLRSFEYKMDRIQNTEVTEAD